MKISKRNLLNYIIAILMLVCSLTVVFISFYDNREVTAQNVILFIGDGMGQNHIKSAELKNGAPLYITTAAKFSTQVTTRSLNSDVTDSAASATALSCGVKTNNGLVSTLDGTDLENMAEYAKKLNKGVGIITTEGITGATPASFSGHAGGRYATEAIFDSQLKSKVDIFISTGKYYLDSNYQKIIDSGASYTTKKSQLEQLTQTKQQKIIAGFNSIPTNNFNEENPSLLDVCKIAINYLTKFYGKNGFFLMIEEAYIDIYSHNNVIMDMIDRVNNLDNAVKGVNDLTKNTNTCVFVTADHETGHLEYLPYEPMDNGWFKKTKHSGENVNIFCYYNKANKIFKNNDIIDNTQISKIIRNLLK